MQRATREILRCGRTVSRRVEFLRAVSRALLDADPAPRALEIDLQDGDLRYRWRAERGPPANFRFLDARSDGAEAGLAGPGVLALPFLIEPADRGELRLVLDAPAGAAGPEAQALADALGAAVAARRAHAALAERVKELTCLYAIARLAEDPIQEADAALAAMVERLPPAWQYPELAVARLVLDGRTFGDAPAAPPPHRLRAPLAVAGVERGHVEVGYQRPEDPQHDVAVLGDDVFLPEEGELLAAVAREIGRFLAAREAREEQARLQEQVRRADRLAAVGHLAAGVAHELNEPLGAILGFAELALASSELGDAPGRDLRRIVDTSLHAREIIRKLLLFARPSPTRLAAVDLRRVAEDALTFLEARCAGQGVRLSRELAPDLPPVLGDAGQLQQVVVNLVVNALHAMPGGGDLTVRCAASGGAIVVLEVEDTGPGMDAETAAQVFLPFFTTKDVGEGTGLGLSVSHGLVQGHGGTLEVDTAPGRGARFVVRLPVRAVPGGGTAAAGGGGAAGGGDGG